MGGLGTLVDRVAGSVRDITITGIEKIGCGWDTIIIPGSLVSPRGMSSLGGMEDSGVYQIYRVSANISGQESSAYYEVCEWHRILTLVLANNEKEQLLKEIATAKEHLPHISKLEFDLGYKVRSVDSLFTTSQMEELVGYLAQHPEGLAVRMRTRGDNLPGNLLQKAYQTLPK